MSWLRKMTAVCLKDLRIELRSRDLLATMGFLALVTVVLFRFAFEFVPTPSGGVRDDAFRSMGSGVLWVTFVFAAVLGLQRSFRLEEEEGALESLMLAPVDRSALLLGKTAAGFLLVCAMEVMVLFAVVVLYGVDLLPVLGPLAAVIAVNTLGFVLVGTVVAFLAGRTRRGGMLLPVLQIPLVLPLLLFAVRATGWILAEERQEAVMESMRLSGVIILVYLGVSLAVFDLVLED